jgi:hypothetical protein
MTLAVRALSLVTLIVCTVAKVEHMASFKLSSPEGAVISIFHTQEKSEDLLESKDLLLEAVKLDCTERGIPLSDDVSCFCALLIKNNPSCLCSTMKSSSKQNAEGVIVDLIKRSAEESKDFPADASIDIDSLPPDVRILEEFKRLSKAVKSLPDGKSAAGTYIYMYIYIYIYMFVNVYIYS